MSLEISAHRPDIQIPSGAAPLASPAIHKPLALVVLLENVGHIAGVALPQWTMNAIDFVTEEYAKLRLKQLGAYRHYDRVIVLEDERATAEAWVDALVETSQAYCVDQLLLVHGQPHSLVGYRGKTHIGAAVFDSLLRDYAQNPALLDLRMVYGLNCYGASLAPIWLQLGASAVNGAVGVNWLPEPSLSLFLQRWLGGYTYSQAVTYSHFWAVKIAKYLWPNQPDGSEHPRIAGSRQIIFGRRDLTITP